MPAPRKTKALPRPAGTKDVFARLKIEEVDEFDAIVATLEPATSRAAVIAMLMRDFMKKAKKGANAK